MHSDLDGHAVTKAHSHPPLVVDKLSRGKPPFLQQLQVSSALGGAHHEALHDLDGLGSSCKHDQLELLGVRM